MGYLAAPQGSNFARSSTFTTGLGILLTGAAIHTKGAYVDVYASVPDPVGYMIVELQPGGVASTTGLVDIAYTVGGGSEHVIASNLGISSGTGFTTYSIPLPVSIPQGATIRARYQRATVTLTMRCAVTLFSNTDAAPRARTQTLGAVTGTTRGTQIDPGGSLNTKGSFVQLTAATDAPINWGLLWVGNMNNNARTDAQYVVDLYVGTDLKVPNLQFSMEDTSDEPGQPYIGPFPMHIPVGSQVQVKAASTINDATDRLFDLIFYGIA